jgi:hypothetical protein
MFRSRRAEATPERPLTTPSANGTHHLRPGPRLKWTDTGRAPDGDFAAIAIANGHLSVLDVPGAGDSWDTVSAFCLSYDGNAYWEDLPELANRVLQRWTRDHALPEKLDVLRGCLFHEQRRWHHLGTEPADRGAAYVRALLVAIAALAKPAPAAPGVVIDPRLTVAPEAHVRLVPAPVAAIPVASDRTQEGEEEDEVEPVAPTPAATVSALPVRAAGRDAAPARVTRLHPVAEAHVQLVASIEADAPAASMAMSGGRVTPIPGSWARHPSAYRSGHRAATASVADLKPMPVAEPLPKPPVIVARSHPAGSARAADGRGVVTALRRPGGGDGAGPDTAACVFHHYDDGYRSWMDAHPEGYVLNVGRASPSGSAVLHRVGCAALRGAPGSPPHLTAATPKVCGTTPAALASWSRAEGAGRPVPCRRCH